MTALPESAFWISPEEYLAGEARSDIRHEYIAGTVHAMAGASRRHNLIAGNMFLVLGNHLRGKKCTPFGSDMKLRGRSDLGVAFYYPDVSVTCDPADTNEAYLENPSILVEVLSPETERTDRREKLLAYRAIPTVETYVLLAQDAVAATVFQREDSGWSGAELRGAGAVLKLPAIGLDVPLGALYERTGLVEEGA